MVPVQRFLNRGSILTETLWCVLSDLVVPKTRFVFLLSVRRNV